MRESNQLVVAESRALLKHHGRTFWFASHFLSPARRDDAAVVYAFCRVVDDTADEVEQGVSPEQVKRDLEQIMDELQGREPARPLIEEFEKVRKRLGFPLSAALELVEGCRQDTQTVRIRQESDLVQYAYRVAGTVGIMMCGVLGVREPSAIAHAIDLGVGMQLTNICRDVLADGEMDRVYLPDLLDDSSPTDSAMSILERQPGRVAEVTSRMLDLADRYYQSAVEGFQYIPVRSRIAIAIAGLAYQSIGLRVRARDFAFQAPRAVVGWPRKLWCVATGTTLALMPPKTAGHDQRLHRDLCELRNDPQMLSHE